MLKDVLLRGHRSYLEKPFAVRSEENSGITCCLLSDRQTTAIESENFVLLNEWFPRIRIIPSVMNVARCELPFSPLLD